MVPPGATAIAAPFTSTVWQIAVQPGERVAPGDKLMSLEAMKMESAVTAHLGGTVAEIYVTPGDQVAPGQLLLAIIGDPT